MGSEGFKTFTWAGWALGYIFIKYPWGVPSFKSFLRFNLFWSFILHSFNMYMLFELAIDHRRMSRTITERDQLVDFIYLTISNVLTAHNFLVYFVFLFRAKLIASVLRRIYNYYGSISSERENIWRCIYGSTLFSWSLTFLGSGLLYTIAFGEETAKNSQLAKAIGNGPFHVVFAFSLINFDMPTNVVLYFVCVTSTHLTFMFEDLSNAVSSELAESKRLSEKGEMFEGNSMKEYFLKKFQNVENLFECAQIFLSPLTLVMVCSSVVQVIFGSYGMAVLGSKESTRDGSWSWTTLCHFILILRSCMVLLSLFVGEHCKTKIEKSKAMLKLSYLNWTKSDWICSENETKRDYDIGDVATLILDFEWNLSALGFFVLNAKLLSGIMKTALSYLIVLVQVQYSLQQIEDLQIG